MNNVTIIIHEGTVCLLPKPEIVADELYPFGFDPTKSKTKSWAFRLLRSSSGLPHLTNEQLADMLKTGRSALNARWEEQVGHSVGWITIYPEAQDGKAGTPHRVELEKGPDLTPEIAIEVEPPHPPRPPLPTPKIPPVEIDIGIF